MDSDLYFGRPQAAEATRRAWALWRLVHDDPRFGFNGRLVNSVGGGEAAAERLLALAGIQSVGAGHYIPVEEVDGLAETVRESGVVTTRYEHLRGDLTAVNSARNHLAECSLPDDLTVLIADASTSDATLNEIASVQIDCGVLPISGSTMRGVARPGVTVYAVDADGKVAAAAGSVVYNHPKGPHATDAFWGFLATRKDRRGQGLAAALGARAMIEAADRFGMTGFVTGVRAENEASNALCAKLGVVPSGWAFLACVDEARFRAARATS